MVDDGRGCLTPRRESGRTRRMITRSRSAARRGGVPLGLHDALVALVLRAAERRLVGGRAQAEKKPWSEGMMLDEERPLRTRQCF
jgi:hypothetical protein